MEEKKNNISCNKRAHFLVVYMEGMKDGCFRLFSGEWEGSANGSMVYALRNCCYEYYITNSLFNLSVILGEENERT